MSSQVGGVLANSISDLQSLTRSLCESLTVRFLLETCRGLTPRSWTKRSYSAETRLPSKAEWKQSGYDYCYERGKGTATPTQIATELGIQSSNVAQVLGELDRRGLLKRTPDRSDKRKVRLSLTPGGINLVSEARARRDQWLSDAVQACLSVQEQEQLLAAGELMQRVALWSEASSQDSD
jgi:DNA-binding MarR family transcriptional regulator